MQAHGTVVASGPAKSAPKGRDFRQRRTSPFFPVGESGVGGRRRHTWKNDDGDEPVGMRNRIIQIKMGARQPPKEFALGWTLLGSAAAIPTRRRSLFGDLEHLTNEALLAAFAISASLFAPVAHTNDAWEAKVRAYVPVVSLAKVCDIRINDATSGDHRTMLEAVKSDPNANKLAYRLHFETQTAYIKARDGGQRVAFCKDFIAANSQYAKVRFTAVVEGHMSDVSTSVQKAIAHNVWVPPRQAVQGRLETVRAYQRDAADRAKVGQGKRRDERLERQEETTAVTGQFCAR